MHVLTSMLLYTTYISFFRSRLSDIEFKVHHKDYCPVTLICSHGNTEVLLLPFFSYRFVQFLLLTYHFCTSKLSLSNTNLSSLHHILAVFKTQVLFHKWCADTFVMSLCTELHKPGFSGSFVETTKKEAKETVCMAALFVLRSCQM